jgi:hypothetical protein
MPRMKLTCSTVCTGDPCPGRNRIVEPIDTLIKVVSQETIIAAPSGIKAGAFSIPVNLPSTMSTN